MSTSTTINIFIKYVNDRFYNKIPYRNSNIIVLYNSFVYDVMAVIPFDHWEAIDEVRPFSDFIVLVSDATAKVEFPDQSIGIIYGPRIPFTVLSISIPPLRPPMKRFPLVACLAF